MSNITETTFIASIDGDSYFDHDYYNDFGGKEFYTSAIYLDKGNFNLYHIKALDSKDNVKSCITLTKHQVKFIIKHLAKDVIKE